MTCMCYCRGIESETKWLFCFEPAIDASIALRELAEASHGCLGHRFGADINTKYCVSHMTSCESCELLIERMQYSESIPPACAVKKKHCSHSEQLQRLRTNTFISNHLDCWLYVQPQCVNK